jgi:hypothetical protein
MQAYAAHRGLHRRCRTGNLCGLAECWPAPASATALPSCPRGARHNGGCTGTALRSEGGERTGLPRATARYVEWPGTAIYPACDRPACAGLDAWRRAVLPRSGFLGGGGGEASVLPRRCQRAGARRPRGQAPVGVEPAAPWQPLRGKCFALHITGCCTPQPRSLAGARSAQQCRATPVMSGAPARSAALALRHVVAGGAGRQGLQTPTAERRPLCGASRSLGSHRIGQRAHGVARQGQALRAREYARP